MEFIQQTIKERRILDDYKSDFFNNEEFGLKVIGAASNYPGITVEGINISDYLRQSEGSISTVIDKINDIESFVTKYRNAKLASVVLLGRFKDIELGVGVLLDKRLVRIGYPRGVEFNSQELADELETLANRISIESR